MSLQPGLGPTEVVSTGLLVSNTMVIQYNFSAVQYNFSTDLTFLTSLILVCVGWLAVPQVRVACRLLARMTGMLSMRNCEVHSPAMCWRMVTASLHAGAHARALGGSTPPDPPRAPSYERSSALALRSACAMHSTSASQHSCCCMAHHLRPSWVTILDGHA